MCELLGMSANVPTDLCFSLRGLVRRGGDTGPHRDGWGIGLYAGRGCRLFHDPRPSVVSEVARLIQDHAIKSRIIISHIRKATHGRVCLENTHPFARELWGSIWVFAHNGGLKGSKALAPAHYRPIGTTDSERAFCWMLGKIRERYPERPRRAESLWRHIESLGRALDALGTCNFLMSDSRCLYAYCSTKLYWITRRAPFGEARSIDTGEIVDFCRQTGAGDVVTVIASKPLTDNERWQPIPPATFQVFAEGLPLWKT
jgi:glutamine amidotransferase